MADQVIPSIDRATATDEERLAWVKARAAAEPWTLALTSVIQDLQLMAIDGERGTRDFVDGLTLGSIDREARSDGQ